MPMAEALGLGVAHTLRSLEERLGSRLLHRTTRSVALTEQGRSLRDRLSPAFAEIGAAVAATKESAHQATGHLRLTAPSVGAQMVLAPVLGGFLRDNPAISVEVMIDDTLVDSVAAGFDGGLRIMEDVERSMTAVPVGGNLRGILVASPQYLDEAGWPQSPQDLLTHRWLNYKFGSSGRLMPWEFVQGSDERVMSIEGPLATNDANLLIAAARDGAGLAYVTDGTVDDLLQSGALVSVLEGWNSPFPGWAIYHPTGRLLTPPMRAFLSYLIREPSGS